MVDLLISMSDDGKITIKGPLNNRVLCYGLLEVGRDLVSGYVVPLEYPAEVMSSSENVRKREVGDDDPC
jgi:hypothetical protein